MINHHLAHAYSAFGASGMTRAAVLVCDNSGSLTTGDKTGAGAREAETISSYVADEDGIRLVDRVSGTHLVDAGSESAYYQPGETDNSLGHFYRTASIAIGLAYTGPKTRFPVSEDGKTMGLAPTATSVSSTNCRNWSRCCPRAGSASRRARPRTSSPGSPRAPTSTRRRRSPGRPRRCWNTPWCTAPRPCTSGPV
ncbi:hypothetical protein ACR6C2_30140 [Streptomyces sp. INA 01156]